MPYVFENKLVLGLNMNLKWLSAGVVTAFVATALFSGAARAQETKSYWLGIRQAGVLRIGAASAPPFLIRDPVSGNYTGFFAELSRRFAAELGVKAEFVDTTWDNMVAGVQAGKWDLAPALDRTPERAIAVNFSIPVNDATYSLAYRKDNPKIPPNPKGAADIDKEDVTISVIAGSAQDKTITGAIKHAKILRLPTNEEVNLAVESKRADIVANESAMNLLFVKGHQPWANVFEPVPALAHRGVGFGLPRSLSAADVQVINIFIEDQKATGEVDRLINEAIDQVLSASK
ncbi:MAG: transporter substrate-binding domain-containing protein [Azospirillaceae bacterium]|nr:transporter substrate-binding domain-containing protein [Azospirillaceae bacterium]